MLELLSLDRQDRPRQLHRPLIYLPALVPRRGVERVRCRGRVAPVAQQAEWVVGAVRMTQHNTPAEARAAGRAINKIVKALI